MDINLELPWSGQGDLWKRAISKRWLFAKASNAWYRPTSRGSRDSVAEGHQQLPNQWILTCYRVWDAKCLLPFDSAAVAKHMSYTHPVQNREERVARYGLAPPQILTFDNNTLATRAATGS